MANKNIGTLQPGQKVTITGKYKATEADMGKADIINTVTARSGTVTAQGASTAAAMEAVRYGLEATKEQTNRPADGEAFTAGETVNWDIKATNTGNQTLTGLEITEKLSGVVMPDGSTFGNIPPKGSATKRAQYNISKSDYDREDLRNVADIKNDKVYKSNIYSPFVVVASLNPFNKLSWSQIAEESDKCYQNSDAYKDWLGYTKQSTIKGYGEVNFRLVSLQPKLTMPGYKYKCFTFLIDEVITSMATNLNVYNDSDVDRFLENDLIELLDDELHSVVRRHNESVYLESPQGTSGDRLGSKDVTLCVPSMLQITGNESYSQENEQYDWFKENSGAEFRIKRNLNGEPTEWMTRTPYNMVTSAGTSDYTFRVINKSGQPALSYVGTQEGIVFSFVV